MEAQPRCISIFRLSSIRMVPAAEASHDGEKWSSRGQTLREICEIYFVYKWQEAPELSQDFLLELY